MKLDLASKRNYANTRRSNNTLLNDQLATEEIRSEEGLKNSYNKMKMETQYLKICGI
jgi:hypothetical protein